MAYSKPKGDISYYLEADRYKKFVQHVNCFGTVTGVYPKARPIAYSTKADYDWLAYLKPLCQSWEELLSKVDGTSKEWLRSPECEKVVRAYMDKKSDFSKIRWE